MTYLLRGKSVNMLENTSSRKEIHQKFDQFFLQATIDPVFIINNFFSIACVFIYSHNSHTS